MHVTFVTLASGEVVSMGILYVAAALRRGGHEVRLLETDDADDMLRDLARNPTDIVAFSATTGLHRLYLAWARLVTRELGLRTLFGGPHPTYFPEVIDRPEVTAIVVGEGEWTTPELLAALAAGDGRAVPGAMYRHEGVIVRGPPRPPEQDLDRLPFPDRSLYFDRRRDHREFPAKVFIASRGCPYRCSYCFNRTLNDMYRGQTRAVRFRSPAEVVREIDGVRKKWPLRLVWFLDANFVVSRGWLEELCGRLRREVRLPFYCKVRPNLVNASIARTLALGGCTGVGLGIEAADDHLRNGVLERNVSREQILESCHRLRDVGISVMTFNMVGLPGETYEMARASVDLNIEAGVTHALATVFQPYPGTRLGAYAVEQGYFDGNYDKLSANYFSGCTMREVVSGDRRRIENLQRLFALAVEFPEVRRRLDWLVERNLPRFYGKLFSAWHKQSFDRKFYLRWENPVRASLEAESPS